MLGVTLRWTSILAIQGGVEILLALYSVKPKISADIELLVPYADLPYLFVLYSIAGITDSFGSYESYYMSGTSDTEYSSESGSVEAVGSYYQHDVSTFCYFTSGY